MVFLYLYLLLIFELINFFLLFLLIFYCFQILARNFIIDLYYLQVFLYLLVKCLIGVNRFIHRYIKLTEVVLHFELRYSVYLD
jgi:hypothetical protein